LALDGDGGGGGARKQHKMLQKAFAELKRQSPQQQFYSISILKKGNIKKTLHT
jgi:hypothetical protein